MATLFNQIPGYKANNIKKAQILHSRNHLLSEIISIRDRLNCSTAEAVEFLRLEMEAERHEFRKNELKIKDEQLAGFGEILVDIANSLELLAETYANQTKLTK